MKRGFKLAILIFVLLICATGIGLGIFLSTTYLKASALELNNDALTSPSLHIPLFDSENTPIKEENTFNGNYVKLSTLPKHTVDAFVSIEDKDFYRHNGVNYKRMAKALLNNIKSHSLKEGASTISQQLIKNTHLTSEKTFERKIKEIALAKKLEKQYSKNEIMEMYLNVVYFGNNCYGIEDAASYYFSTNAHDLDIQQSATLASLLKSPNRYSPVSNYNLCIKRRNLVLDEMEKDGKITIDTCLKEKAKPISLKLNTTKKNKLNSYSQACIDEAESILKLPAKQIALNGYKIYTYLDKQKQADLIDAFNLDLQGADHAGIVIDNYKSGIVAYNGKSTYKILEARRQPGSCLKPVLVYGPALNEDIIYPCTPLLDEKTTIAGYSPKNVGEKYRGYVSARESLSRSINIPAVKVLSYVGIDKAKSYASEMGITFDEKDDNFALALGGMNYGTNLRDLAGAYTTLANGGKYSHPRFISFITDKNNKLVYIHRPEERQVLREDSSYLLTDMLMTCAKEGTARKLSDVGTMLASKTGTVGVSGKNAKNNLDAWNITYSRSQTVGVWVGNLDNTPITIAGGNEPTSITRQYFLSQNDTSTFERPDSIAEHKIDSIELANNHRVVLANNFTPEIYTESELFSSFNLPKEISRKFVDVPQIELKGSVQDGKAILTLESQPFLTYEIYEGAVENKNRIATIEGKSNTQNLEFDMKDTQTKFIVKSFYKNSPSNFSLREINLIKTKSQAKQKWYV